MKEAFDIVNSAPTPNLLIFIGIALIILGLVGKFGAHVDIPRDRQRWVAGFGVLLLLSGVALTIVPILRQSTIADAGTSQALSVQGKSETSSTVAAEKQPSVAIDGPPSIPFGATTYFTILTENAVRGTWSIGGFTNGPITVDPLAPSHQIYVEPVDKSSLNNKFTIVFIAKNSSGVEARAEKSFLVVPE